MSSYRDYEFPVCLPDPDNIYTPYVSPYPPNPFPPFPPALPRQTVVTYPGLFPAGYGGVFFPHFSVDYLTMGDMIRMQMLFAARQFLTARCREQGVPDVPEGNPFIVSGSVSSVQCLYSELSLLSATLGNVRYHSLLRARVTDPLKAYYDFRFDLSQYAPWYRLGGLELDNGVRDLHRLIKQSQDKLRELQAMTDGYRAVKRHFEEGQDAMGPPERERRQRVQ